MKLTADQVHAAQSLQPVETPPEVSWVEGCSCGGNQYCGHRVDCTVFRLSPAEIRAAEDAAQRRSDEFDAALTAAFYDGWQHG
jgi:hypothetical protein